MSTVPNEDGARASEGRRNRETEIAQHVEMIHRIADGLVGKLVVASFGENPFDGKKITPKVRHFVVGDVAGMVAEIARLDAEQYRNAYVPLALMKMDLARGEKGREADVLAVLGLVADFDDTDAERYAQRMPVPADYVLETSAGRFQAFLLFDQPLPMVEAKKIAIALKDYTASDSCDKDVSHVWRVAGTQNRPKKSKVDAGRSPDPQTVRVVRPWRGTLTGVENLREALNTGGCPNGNIGGRGVGHEVQPSRRPPRYVQLDSLPDDVGFGSRVGEIIVQGQLVDEPKQKDNSRSAWLWDALCQLVRAGVADDDIASIILDSDYAISRSVLDKRDPREEAVRQIRRAHEEVASGIPAGKAKIECATDKDKPTPMQLAQGLLATRATRLLRFNGEWLSHDSGAYRAREEEGVRAEVWKKYPNWNSAIVSNILDAMRASVHLDKNEATPPCWLDRRAAPSAERLLVLRNGVLDLEGGTLIPHTNALFTRNALEFDYDHNAPSPDRWLRFLGEIWPEEGERDCVEALQRIFGYLLTPDTSQQKIFVLVGPTRCGKGTIGRVLRNLFGQQNICSPTLTTMSTDFGLQCMIGKQLALVSDMRVGARTDRAAVAETLLRISGEDSLSVPRKHQADWEGRLAVRFVIMSNEAPTLNDPSGALLARYVVLQMHQSFLGREDRTLDAQLARELPGILNWAIEGRRLMCTEGGLIQPKSAEDVVMRIRRLDAPLAAFIEDECELAADTKGQTSEDAFSVDKDELYDTFKRWCTAQDFQWKGSKEVFAKMLLVTCRQVRASKLRVGGDRTPVYRGIRLKPSSRPPY